MVLVLVGGVGATGALGPADAPRLFILPFQQAASAPDPAQPEITIDGGGLTDSDGQTDGAGRPATASPPPAETGGAGMFASPEAPNEASGQGGGEEPAEEPVEEPASRGEDLDVESIQTSGWVLLLAAGVGLLAVAMVLRRLSPNRIPAER
jgi:hypothetical protein